MQHSLGASSVDVVLGTRELNNSVSGLRELSCWGVREQWGDRPLGSHTSGAIMEVSSREGRFQKSGFYTNLGVLIRFLHELMAVLGRQV